MIDAAPVRVLHLDHTIAEGGAEYALQRMFVAGTPWSALLMLPPADGGAGVYAERGGVRLLRAGVRQPAGVSAGGLRVVGATVRLLVQALATRCHPAFRSADVIDANTARAAAYGALAALAARKPFVVHLRDMIDPEALGQAGFALMRGLVLPRADGVVADTHATLASAAPYLRDDVERAAIPSASGLRRGIARSETPGPVKIGMLARIDPWKGQRVLLEAFAEAFAHSDAELELAGGAPFGHEGFLDELTARAEALGISQRVRFLGHVDDVDALLATWHVAVHASTRPEPLGQNVLQYLAAGLATIVADEGGPTEFVDDGVNGLRVAPRDPGLLAEALRRLADDPSLRERLGRAAIETPGLLSDSEVVDAHADFYARVLARKRVRRGADGRSI